MNLQDLNKVAIAMVAPGKGILAADESSGTIKNRFDAIGVESTADNRRDYRELLFRSKDAMTDYISGVILYDETIRQNAADGTPLVKLISDAGSIPGIKVDAGAKPLPASRARPSPKASTASQSASRSTTTSAPASRNGAP
jgi:fructose-bisphosphate aldolase class I